MSTFHGLEMAKQALFAQQAALYTTGNNISNANTKGYSRQRVNFDTQNPYPTASMNRPQIPGQMGTGVKVGSVERVRDQFLDTQFRGENSKVGYWETKSAALSRMENLLNETTDRGLSKSMDLFWDSLQDLATNPTNSGARSVVVQRGVALADSFNYMSKSLKTIRSDLKSEIGTTEEQVNSLLKQIDRINKQVKETEVHGYLANDLYDERDRLIDELSGILNIEVSYDSSGGGSLASADGVATIKLLDVEGDAGEDIILVNGESGGINEMKIHFDGDQATVDKITFGKGENLKNELSSILGEQGSLSALIDSYGYMEDGAVSGEYPKTLANLDAMTEAFIKEFNEVHGYNSEDEENSGIPFFDPESLTAGTIEVNKDIVENPDLMRVNSQDGANDGKVAKELAKVFENSVTINDKETSVKGYFGSLIGELGVRAQEANKMAGNTNILLSQVNNQRQSVSSVSLDEEMSNMIKFQHAYNAAARSMTTIDEMLDRIINSMGLVGR